MREDFAADWARMILRGLNGFGQTLEYAQVAAFPDLHGDPGSRRNRPGEDLACVPSGHLRRPTCLGHTLHGKLPGLEARVATAEACASPLPSSGSTASEELRQSEATVVSVRAKAAAFPDGEAGWETDTVFVQVREDTPAGPECSSETPNADGRTSLDLVPICLQPTNVHGGRRPVRGVLGAHTASACLRPEISAPHPSHKRPASLSLRHSCYSPGPRASF